MQNDFRLLTPTTIVLDALAITSININFNGEHTVTIYIKDNQNKEAAIVVRDGDSGGLNYSSGVWEPTSVETLTGTTDVVTAMLQGALPGLAAWLLSSGLLISSNGIEIIQPSS